MAVKLPYISESLQKCLLKFMILNLAANPHILVPEYNQSNATRLVCIQMTLFQNKTTCNDRIHKRFCSYWDEMGLKYRVQV